jgi:hypothetical protein
MKTTKQLFTVTAILLGACAHEGVAQESAPASISAQPEAGKAVSDHSYIVDPKLQEMVDSLAKGAATNGMACGLQFDRAFGRELGFSVHVINVTTNFVRGFIRMPLEGFAKIDLYDSSGKPVKKTKAGNEVGWTDSQIRDYHAKLKQKRADSYAKYGSASRPTATAFFPLWPETIANHTAFSELFQLTSPGEYTFHLQMRVAQNQHEKDGKTVLHIYWLPEVVAKIQLLTSDIPKPEVPSSNSSTNKQML